MSSCASFGAPGTLPPPGPSTALPPGAPALPSQQQRLRHLQNIAARNIVNRNGHQLLDTYFTLHLCDNEKIYKEFYRSEVIKNSLNPTRRTRTVLIHLSFFVVKIWGGKGDAYHLLIEWKVYLDGLKYLGQQIHAHNQNEIIFGLNDGYYGATFEPKGHSNTHNILQCAIKQTPVIVQRIGKVIEKKLRLTSTSNELKNESECLRLKFLVGSTGQRKCIFSSAWQLQHQKESLSEFRKECTAKIELFLKTNAQLTIRCRQLLSELSYIYPIDLNGHKDYSVCGVKLPNSEGFQAKDDGSIAIALGYTAHLVSMISFFLQGSISTIKDNINDKLTEKEQEFPLYSKGGEKLQFDYGVYLLNKNIAQLRYQHGLATPDLRQTLPNLKNFMEHGLMIRCDRHQTSSAIPVPKRQRSMSGGADVGSSGVFLPQTKDMENGPAQRLRDSNTKPLLPATIQH
uniref:UVRAG n=1 Tax=Cricetulus griseus TaxID=10029 RepID=A0A8C2M0T3_CRIGR